MKKFLWRIALPVIAVALAITSASGPMTKTVMATSSGPVLITHSIVRGANDTITVEGDEVTVPWLTDQFMDGKVLITSPYSNEVVYETGGLKTFHTVKFNLWPGTYDLQPVSVYKFQTFKGLITTVIIEENKEIFIPEVEGAPYIDEIAAGIEFKDHLLQEQIEELLELYDTPYEGWTTTDWANWIYATE